MFTHNKSYINRTPLLVSSKLLRSKGMGQVDLLWINNKDGLLIMAECKTGSGRLSKSQKMRLIRTGLYLASIFEIETKIIKFTQVAKTAREHYPFRMEIIKELSQ